MCCIVGYHLFREHKPTCASVHRGLRTMRHRGPDDEGITLIDPERRTSLDLLTENSARGVGVSGRLSAVDEIPHRVCLGTIAHRRDQRHAGQKRRADRIARSVRDSGDLPHRPRGPLPGTGIPDGAGVGTFWRNGSILDAALAGREPPNRSDFSVARPGPSSSAETPRAKCLAYSGPPALNYDVNRLQAMYRDGIEG